MTFRLHRPRIEAPSKSLRRHRASAYATFAYSAYVSKPTTLPEHVTRDEDRAISRRDMMLRTAAAGFASCASIHAAGSLSSRDQRNPARSLNEMPHDMPHDMPQELGTDMSTDPPLPRTPFTILLGIAQDGGFRRLGRSATHDGTIARSVRASSASGSSIPRVVGDGSSTRRLIFRGNCSRSIAPLFRLL